MNPDCNEIRLSIWDENETLLFETDSHKELLEKIGDFEEAPLRMIGNNINFEGQERTITNLYFGLNKGLKGTKLHFVIEIKAT